MPDTSAIPDFRKRRQHGQCPACDHSGIDCHCHKQPKKAAAIFAQRQIDIALKSIATARKVVEAYKLKADTLMPAFMSAEVGSTYVDAGDRFVVSLVVGYDRNDGVSTPEQAVGAALEFITTDDGAENTHWYCFDRQTGVLHRVEQRRADARLSLIQPPSGGKDNTMLVKIIVTAEIQSMDEGRNFTEEKLRASAREAIDNALELCADLGFDHELAATTTIHVASVEVCHDVSSGPSS